MSTCLVLGAGVQGLTCALRLRRQGWKVVVIGLPGGPAETVSWGAGAVWEYPPFHIEPKDSATRWVRESLPPFCALAAAESSHDKTQNSSGVRLLRLHYVFRDGAMGRAAFAGAGEPPGAALELQEGLPPPGLLSLDAPHTYGYSYLAPVICMSVYLPWLQAQLLSLGEVRFETAEIKCIADITKARVAYDASLVVNSMGFGAREVFGDSSVHGVLGDLVYVRCPQLEQDFGVGLLADEDNPNGLTYLIPQVGGIVGMAGTAEEIPFGETHSSELHGAERRAGIQRRCAGAFAVVADKAPVLGSWSGLRPERKGGVRLELVEDLECGALIHNYGHGGSGVMTSWACAEDVADLAFAVAQKDRLLLRPLQSLPVALSKVLPLVERHIMRGARANL